MRGNFALNVLVYAVVGGLVLSQVTPKVRLRWGDGPALTRVAFGAAFGLGGGTLAVAAVSGSAGHLSTDPRAIQMMSGGDIAHVVITILLVCIAAPLVEEILFRGLLLESLRQHNLRMAIIVSAMFFAVWQLNKTALVYYTAMGCVFGVLYAKRGLVASMSAHAGFNGVLTIAAIAILFGPSHLYKVGGLEVSVPSGWATEDSSSALPSDLPFDIADGNSLVLDGPEASALAMVDIGPPNTPFDADTFSSNLKQRFGNLPVSEGLSYDINSLREVTLPSVGTAVELDIHVHSSRGEYAFFSYGGDLYFVFAIIGESAKASSDVNDMLTTLLPQPGVVPAS